MTLPIGTRLGPYEITSLLGAGGMGEVYRATDTRLGRQVAIKVLPEAFAHDMDRLGRFEREARALAALNHPNIAQIHGFVDGPEGSRTRAIVMELVDGATLADRIGRRPMRAADALAIARQLALALEAAHAHGIVHRDLKPANIAVRADGAVKVLDFGLAKLAGKRAGHPSIADTEGPTTLAAVTGPNVVLGTAGYMSPEQTRGQEVDEQADIWAFGCVLFEMLSGRAPFARGTPTDTAAAILEREPPWDALAAGTPSDVRRLLRRCLEKDPRRRLHHIADARIELDDLVDNAAAPASMPATDRARALAGPIVIVAALIAAGAAWRIWPVTEPTPDGFSRMTIAASGTSGVSSGRGHGIAIDRDGSRIVYIGDNARQLFVRQLDQLDATVLFTSVAPLNGIALSPDGKWVAFFEGSTLRKVAVTGGPATTLVVSGNASRTSMSWVSNETIVFATGDPANGLLQISAGGGDVTMLSRPDAARGEGDHVWPEVLPGGQAILFTITAASGPAASQVALFDLATRTHKVLIPGASDARYVPSGHLLYTAGGQLLAVQFDPVRRETSGAPITILPRFASVAGATDIAAAADGTLAYVESPAVDPQTTLVWVDRRGREEPLGTPPRRYFHPRLSPEGTRVAVAVAERENEHIWLWDLAKRIHRQLTFDPAGGFARSGLRIVCCSLAATMGCSSRPPTGQGSPSGSEPACRPA